MYGFQKIASHLSFFFNFIELIQDCFCRSLLDVLLNRLIFVYPQSSRFLDGSSNNRKMNTNYLEKPQGNIEEAPKVFLK